MKTKLYTVEFEWEIRDTRETNPGFRTGRSILHTEAKSLPEAINDVIRFCNYLPSWELEHNNINIQDYREYPKCTYYYRTQLSNIISIEVSK